MSKTFPNNTVIRFDGPPGPVSGRFIEVERNGASINAGEWLQDGDDWLLVLGYAQGQEAKPKTHLYEHFLKAKDATIGQEVWYGKNAPEKHRVVGIDFSNPQCPKLHICTSYSCGTNANGQPNHRWTETVIDRHNGWGYDSQQIFLFASYSDYLEYAQARLDQERALAEPTSADSQGEM